MMALPLRFSSVLLSILLFTTYSLSLAEANGIYVVYMGSVGDADPAEVHIHNQKTLATLHNGSLEKAKESMIYSYKHAFRGFAAVMTLEQTSKLADMTGVISYFPSQTRTLQTSRSWEFLGLQSDSNLGLHGISHERQEDTIIGFLDSGIWPESESFRGEGLSPVPSRWKGQCQTGDSFASTSCNRKLIGARFYSKGFEAEAGPINGSAEFKSPRDAVGHGTHVSSIGAGRFVRGASLDGLGDGTIRGGIPRARIAMYKTCWRVGGDAFCHDPDILAAFDDAIRDGVDILSLSFSSSPPQLPFFQDSISIASFHAVAKGITVSASAGNSGLPSSATNIAPWIITVGASTIDRDFESNVMVGNGDLLKGESLYPFKLDVDKAPLVLGSEVPAPPFTSANSSFCHGVLDREKVEGKIVVCEEPLTDPLDDRTQKSLVVSNAGGVGMILVDEIAKDLGFQFFLPSTIIGQAEAQKLISYINSTRSPMASITQAKTVEKVKPAPVVAIFSAKGPSIISPDIIKPDIVAPGVNILAAWSPVGVSAGLSLNFNIESGTSMACPHVTGAAALIKAAHPSWSPAAIKSALMTTAIFKNNKQNPIKASVPGAVIPATPFDMGSGHLNPSKALYPGLVYDANPTDFIMFLLGLGYNQTAINSIIGGTDYANFSMGPAQPVALSPSDLNYPSIAVGQLAGKKTIRRRVTNVGKAESVYKAFVEAPAGVGVKVWPDRLVFHKKYETQSFVVELSVERSSEGKFVFGSLTWMDGIHSVRSPIALNAVSI